MEWNEMESLLKLFNAQTFQLRENVWIVLNSESVKCVAPSLTISRVVNQDFLRFR